MLIRITDEMAIEEKLLANTFNALAYTYESDYANKEVFQKTYELFLSIDEYFNEKNFRKLVRRMHNLPIDKVS
jgi:hypothetical protein